MINTFLAQKFLKQLEKIEKGNVKITMPNGHHYHFHGRSCGAEAQMEVRDIRVISNMAMKGNVAFAEDYRDGLWHTDNLENLMTIAIDNKNVLAPYMMGKPMTRLKDWFLYLLRENNLSGSRKNIHAHYDLGNDFYKLWLDQGMTYSSALFEKGDTLETAQDRKYDRLLDGLENKSGSLLEIGCGWGGFSERALARGDFDIKALTLSQAQADFARQRLGGNVNVAIEDYRLQNGQYDNIVSIEMFEAVGEKYWSTYFAQLARLLKKGGKAMIQTITIHDDEFEKYKNGTDFIRSHIFPGGMLPSLSKFKECAAQAGLRVEDVFTFGQDYARTLSIWLENFTAQWHSIKHMGFDDPFARMWSLYLAGCAAGFRTEQLNVVQIRLAHV